MRCRCSTHSATARLSSTIVCLQGYEGLENRTLDLGWTQFALVRSVQSSPSSCLGGLCGFGSWGVQPRWFDGVRLSLADLPPLFALFCVVFVFYLCSVLFCSILSVLHFILSSVSLSVLLRSRASRCTTTSASTV